VNDEGFYDLNLAALRTRSPEAARILDAADVSAEGVRVVPSASGRPLVEVDGRALESRRDPAGAAERLAIEVTASPVVVAGMGAGYLPEALLARGIDVRAVIEPSAAVLMAALRARDLRPLLDRVPVLLLSTLTDRIRLAQLRAEADVLVPHEPSLSGSANLAALVTTWPSLVRADRAPRVLVAGPIYGGSLETARATSRAVSAIGAETRLFDFSIFADGQATLSALRAPSAAKGMLLARYADVLGQALVEVAREWKADLVIALAQAPLGEAALDQLRQLGIPSAFWFVENGRVLTYWRQMARHYDWFYAIQPGRFLEQLADAGAPRPRYLPTACDPERHVPVALTDEERRRFGSDVSFAGAPYLNRRKLLASLGDLDFRVWGEGWQHEPALAHAVAGDARRFSLDEMIRIFAATKININLHSANHVADFDPEPDYVNPRTFELASCGAFQMIDWRSPLADLFADDEVVTFRSIPELRDQIAYYVRDEEARHAVATRARARALAEHAFVHRVERILCDALPAHLAAAVLRGVSAETLDQALLARERTETLMDDDEVLMRILFEVEKNWGLR